LAVGSTERSEDPDTYGQRQSSEQVTLKSWIYLCPISLFTQRA